MIKNVASKSIWLYEYLERLEGKIRDGIFFMLIHSKIRVCTAHHTQRCILQWKFGDKLILTLYSFWSKNQIMIILHDFADIQFNFKDLRDMIFRSHACLLHINDSFENMSFYILRFLIAANISVSLHVYHD